ncbi:SET domain-containing protein [Artemisia annua]|uniref:SET domain-containing protein n=1 Tax=Artemisia annua TaxID=35608 RepID=A0A2U1QAK5_ARTAN|nr:SET domain-containing protein [Artemisia annua]
MGSLSQTHEVPHSVDEECSHLLPWLRQKAGAEISSHLTIGKSVYGRSLFASKPIQAGDCILKIPHSLDLTADNLHPSVSSLLGEGVDDDVKLALVVLLHQKLGQASELAPYISCLPRVEEMHNTMLWSNDELEMIKTSLLYEITLQIKDIIEEEFLNIKHVLDRFPEYFEDVTLHKFKHAYNLDFFNHDIDSETRVLNDDFEPVSKVIAGKNYAPGDEVFIRYKDVTNDKLLLQYGFMNPSSEYHTVLVEFTVPQHDHLHAMKLDLLDRHLIPDEMGLNVINWFIVRNVERSCVEGRGISIELRAFARVAMESGSLFPQKMPQWMGIPLGETTLPLPFPIIWSSCELQQLAMEATEDDGHLARVPLKNKAREMEAHQFLRLRFDDMIENHSAALEANSVAFKYYDYRFLCPSKIIYYNTSSSCTRVHENLQQSLTRAASPTLSGKCARRMQLARDLLTNDLQILRSASVWLKNYCEALKV